MTISSATRKAGPFLGNGVTTVFPFAFKVFDATDLQVTKTSASGVDAVLTLNSDYFVTLNADQNGSPGGSIAYPLSGSSLQNGEKLTVTGVLPALQSTHITNGGNFFANNIEDQMDYLTILVQQNTEKLARVPLGSPSDDPVNMSIGTAAQRANTYVAFDSSGNVSLSTSLPSGTLSQASIVSFLGADPIARRTAAEIAAGVTPTNYAYPERHVLRYGVNTTPGTTDMTAAFTSALAVCKQAVPSGTDVSWGAVCAIVPANQPFAVTSVSIPSGCGLACADGVADIIALSNNVGAVLDTQVLNSGNTPCYDITLRNIYIHGPGSSGTVCGLRLNNVQTSILVNVFFDNLPGPALVINSKADGTAYNNMGIATSLTGAATAQDTGGYNLKAFNCLQNTAALTSRIGAFNVMGSDHDFYSCAIWNPLARSLSSSNKYAPAWNLVGVNESRFTNCKGSVSDQGWYLDANTGQNFFASIRADGNFAEGIECAGSLNWFEQIDLNSNGQATNNTYDNLVFDSTAGRNHVASGIASNGGGASNVARYCVTDKNAVTGSPNRIGAGFLMKDAATGGINNQGGSLSVTLPDGAPQSFTNGATTPPVVSGNQPFKNWTTSNGSATSITNFTGGFVGQVIRVEAGDSVTTIVNNSSLIRTLSGSNISASAGQIFDFKLNPNGYWQQI